MTNWNRKNDDPNGGETENCLLVSPYNYKMVDFNCNAERWTICHLHEVPKLRMKGFCTIRHGDDGFSVNLDVIRDGRFVLQSLRTYALMWNETYQYWNIIDMSKPEIIAYTNDTTDYPLGKHTWYFIDGKCHDEGKKGRWLTLHNCGEDEFSCGDGVCIDIKYACDRKKNCADASDEYHCDIVNFPDPYIKDIAPPMTYYQYIFTASNQRKKSEGRFL